MAARISVVALLSTLGVSEKMADFVNAISTMSTLGKPGSNQWGDRFCESINDTQQVRSGKFAAFERSIAYTPHLVGMLHVEHAYSFAKDGEAVIDDPLRQTMLNAGEAVRQSLKARLGTDITIANDTNPCFYTDGKPKVDRRKLREHMPHEYMWAVAEGRSTGPGRAVPERWDTHYKKIIRESMFKK